MSNRNKYEREIIGLNGETAIIDVYRTLEAFNVTNPMAQHAIKKLLCMGLRGHKDTSEDLDDAIDSLQKMKKYLGQKQIALIAKQYSSK